MATEIKTCCSCKESKPLEAFHKAIKKSFGVHSVCKACKSLYDKKRNKPTKPWSELTEEQKQKKYAYKKEWRKRRNSLKPKRLLKTREEKLAKKKITDARWRATSPHYKISRNLRSHLKRTIKRHIKSGFTTIGNSGKVIGCSGNELIKHIETTWTEGMTWANYGWGKDKWVIDHIRPLIDFIRSGDDPRKANHYTNLRALWYTDNAKKSVKDRDEPFSSNPTPNPSPEYEPELESEGDTDTVLKGGQ